MKNASDLAAIRPITTEDIVPDEPLQGVGKANISAEQDLLHHRVIARRIAELAISASGKVNVALFGPWGAGKSSFNALLREELADVDKSVGHVTFDAWKNSGEGFRANFLSELARQISPRDRHIPDQLFQGTTKVSFPFGATYVSTKTRRIVTSFALPLALVLLFFGAPLVWTLVANQAEPTDDFGGLWWRNIQGWGAFGVGSTLIVVVMAGLLELSKVTVSRSMPSHVAQFSKLFDQLLAAGRRKRYVVFVDELDRCSPDDVVKTLEGLRTFLGDDRCVFVVAFDRDAIAETISKHVRHAVPEGPVAPYYGTSGEYLDKIFQFQLSLPPQAAHTFRRYALSLVASKGGVWADLRSHKEHLLERVITVLAPMHLASPRRTKVLLNDFAVSARIYESLGFNWVQFAEEIAVLSVLRTEFPALMADIERTPALMRFLFRNETPNRAELVALIAKYAEPSASSEVKATHLDRVIESADEEAVSDQLLVNLHRYIRRLLELRVPEPRAELIMMHSGGALVHFEDPAVYDAVLLAPDSPRRDIVLELAQASEGDRVQAVQHILEQAERESAQIAEHLRILAGEISAALTNVPIPLSDALRAAITSGLDEHSEESLRGYARAISADFSLPAAQELIDAAEKSHGSAGGLITQFAETLTDSDWERAHPLVVKKALDTVLDEPEVFEVILRRIARTERGLEDAELGRLAEKLSVTKPAAVKPEAATAAARQAADEENALALAEYEGATERARTATGHILTAWEHATAGRSLRRALLQVLRDVEDDSNWHLDKHDALIEWVRDEGDVATSNRYLLDAIIEEPKWAAVRWRGMLSNDAPVEAEAKGEALRVVIHRATTANTISVSENGAGNAMRIAQLPSEPLSALHLSNMVDDDVAKPWGEYSDNRFEYQWTLLAALDVLEDAEVSTTDLRTRLVLGAVEAAQKDEASVDEIVRRVNTVSDQQAVSVASALRGSDLWEQDDALASQEVLLAVQLRVLAAESLSVEPLPSEALTRISDRSRRSVLSQSWLQTAPSAAQVEEMLLSVDFSPTAWRTYASRASETDRSQLWETLRASGASRANLVALGSAGMPVEVYKQAATAARDAQVTKARRAALDMFLTLPAAASAASIARWLLKEMSMDAKVTEVPFGVDLIRAYAQYWTPGTRSSLRGTLTPWVEAGEKYTTKTHVSWLARQGFIAKKSSLFERFFNW